MEGRSSGVIEMDRFAWTEKERAPSTIVQFTVYTYVYV